MGAANVLGGLGGLLGYFIRAGLLLCLCLAPIAAGAKTKVKKAPKPDLSMQFAVVRGSSPLCEPNCPEWIWAEGEIRPDTAKRFKKFLKTIGDRKLPVIIQSPGGDLDAAIAMGRAIRARKLDVAVGYTTFISCAPRQKGCDAAKNGGYTGIAAVGLAYCNSACPMVLAGGTRRLVGTWGHLGVHQVTTTMVKEKILYKTTTRIVNGKKVVRKKIVNRKKTGSYETTKMSKALRRQIEAYLTEMGVSTGLLEPINKTPASELLRLDQSQMLALKLITSLDQLGVLVGPTICKAESVPANCREVPMPAGLANDRAEATSDRTPKNAPPNPNPGKGGNSGPSIAGEMRFAIIRGKSPLCIPNCPEWISAEGTITRFTPDALGELLESIKGRRLPVLIHSAGGDLFGAMATGRLIRKHALDTAVAKSYFVDCPPEKERCNPVEGVHAGLAVDQLGECAAACLLMLAGGVRRYVGPQADLHVRKLALESRVAAYLDEMEIEPRFLIYMQQARWKPIKLGPGMMRDFRLVTGPESADHLTDSTVCKAEPVPANCRVMPIGR